MWEVRRVVGDSMSPTLTDGQLILLYKTRKFKVGDVVVAFMNHREVVKRIIEMSNGYVFLEGDNKNHSTDSREHGKLIDRHVIGKIVLPKFK
ncbi:MAG: S26 family signal peptidase [Candidatus Saccharibacteria bacterium]|nr:S26 family signal peptidase [Candidatus Saccharibacteria bacterium]